MSKMSVEKIVRNDIKFVMGCQEVWLKNVNRYS